MVVEIVPGLLLGSMSDVIALLGSSRSYGVSHLLSVLNSPIDWSEIKTPQGCLMAKYVSAPDLPTSDLLTHFPACVQFIEDCIEGGGNVLVHCEHGISRSATMVLAFLMKTKGIGFVKAMTFLKDKKPDIRPNLGFQEQLKLWEMMKYKLDDSCKSYRAYTLHHQAQAMKKNGYVDSMQLSPNPVQSHVDKGALYKCRKCRCVLLSSEHVLQHEIGGGGSAFPRQHRQGNSGGANNYFTLGNNAKGKLKNEPINEITKEPHNQALLPFTSSSCSSNPMNDHPPVQTTCAPLPIADNQEEEHGNGLHTTTAAGSGLSTVEGSVMSEMTALRSKVLSLKVMDGPIDEDSKCSSLFVEPVEWMGPFILGHVDGKLLCPRCSSRIGSFDWSGTQCSCGRWVTPSFKITKSKTDVIRCA